MSGGAFLIARSVYESEIRTDKPSRRLKVRIYLIGKANHKEKGKFKRGQFHTDYETIYVGCKLAKEGVKKKSLQNVIAWLTERQMLRTQKRTRGVHITIEKYDHFQTLGTYVQDTEKDNRRTETGQRQDTKNKYVSKKVSKNNNKYIQDNKFIELVEAYTADRTLQQAIYEYRDFRKSINKPISTEGTMSRMFKELDKYNLPETKIAVLQQSIDRGRMGLFPLKQQQDYSPAVDKPVQKRNYSQRKSENEQKNQARDILHGNR